MATPRLNKNTDLGPLKDGSKVIIIGGGPAGTGCALALHRKAAAIGRRIQITLIENKQFAGERQHNQCVGVLSPPITSLIETELGLPFPNHLIQSCIKGYVLHTADESIVLNEFGELSLSLRRVQFDAYMLEAVKQLGIHVIQARAVGLEFYDDRVVVYTENIPLEGDVIVGAWGMDEGSGTLFNLATGYQPPQALSTIVTKFHPGEKAMMNFAPYIHAFIPKHPRIEFGGVTPKLNHLTINIAGRTVDSDLMYEFLAMPAVRSILPVTEAGPAEIDHSKDFRLYKGRFPCSLAKKYYGNRYVTVGDAAGLVRAFKGKGITSGIQTGIRAAEVMLCHGISEWAFHQHYLTANNDIIKDFPYGRSMRYLTIFMARFRLLNPVLRAAKKNIYLQHALFGAVSGNEPYQKIMRQAFDPRSIRSILQEMAGR